MIKAKVQNLEGRTEILMFNNLGEVDTENWREEDFSFAVDFADRHNVLLVDTKDYLNDLSAAYGFHFTDDSVVRNPRGSVNAI
jgi:hypothetical protein